MASRPSSSSASAARKVQVHSKQQSLRAASKQKLSQQQRQAALSSSCRTSQSSKGDADVASSSQAATTSSLSTSSKVALGKRKEQDATEHQLTQRKQVFKQVLASPLTVNWPSLAAVDAQPVLYTLLDMLALPALRLHVRRVQPSRPDRREMSRSERRQARKAVAEAKVTAKKVGKVAEIQSSSSPPAQMGIDGDAELADTSTTTKPGALVCGINSITRHIELEIAHQSTCRRAAQSEGDPTSTTAPSHLRLIFLCRNDLDPPKLVAHFPMLTCALNAVCHPLSKKAEASLLIPLPKGAERLLTKSLGLRRCAALGIATELLPEEVTQDLFARIAESGLQPLRADWLESAADSALRTRETLLARSGLTQAVGVAAAPELTSNTVVKNVSSTAPVNLNAVKLQKKHTRDEKKAWRKSVKKEKYGQDRKWVIRERKKRRETRRRGGPSRDEQRTGEKEGKPKGGVVNATVKVDAKSTPS